MEYEKKDHVITIRVAERQKKELEELADRFGVSSGFIIRRMVLAGLRRQGKQSMTLKANVS